MNKKAGKIIALLLIAALALSFAACGGQKTGKGTSSNTEQQNSTVAEGSASTTAKEELPEYVLSMYNSIGGTQEIPRSDLTKVGAIIKEKFNIVFNIQIVAGDYQEKCAIMLASGDYPELLGLNGDVMVQKYINADALIKLDDLVDKYGQNFKEFHKEAMPLWRSVSDDGGLYKYEFYNPNYVLAVGAQNDIIVRSDLLEKQGWPELLSADSYYEFIKESLKSSPETDGQKNLGLIMPGGAAYAWKYLYATLLGKGGVNILKGIGQVNLEKGAVESLFENPDVKDSLIFLNKLYKEGLLDPECFTDSDQQIAEKLKKGKAVAALYTKWLSDSANAELRKNGKANMEYVPMSIRSDSQYNKKSPRYIPVIGSYAWCSMVITKKAKYPERIMKLLDWAATDEGQVALGWGIEGVHYTVDKNGMRTVTDEFRNGYSTNPNYLMEQGITAFDFLGLTVAPGKNGQINTCTLEPTFISATLSDRAKEFLGKYGWNTLVDTWKKRNFEVKMYNNSMLNLTIIDSTSDEGKIEAKINELFNKNMPALIMAENDSKFNNLWDKLIVDAKALGYDKVIEKYDTVYKENVKKYQK